MKSDELLKLLQAVESGKLLSEAALAKLKHLPKWNRQKSVLSSPHFAELTKCRSPFPEVLVWARYR